MIWRIVNLDLNSHTRGWAVGVLAMAGIAEARTLLSAAIAISQTNDVKMVGSPPHLLTASFIELNLTVAR